MISSRIRGILATAVILLLITALPSAAQTADPKAEVERMSQEIERAFKGLPQISPRDLASPEERKKYVFLDVRSPKETQVSMIPGAIGVEEFVNNVSKYQDKDLVLYCTIGVRSGKAVLHLMAQGLKVKSLRGGVLGWVHAGLPMQDHNGPTKKIHVYGREWELLPAGYQGVR